MSTFDPYHRWLGIPPEHQPPDHYRLLSLERFEDDPAVIEAAADRQMGYVRLHATGQHSDLSQELLNEISKAKLCLLVPEKKAEYDRQLRAQQAAKQAEAEQAKPDAPRRQVRSPYVPAGPPQPSGMAGLESAAPAIHALRRPRKPRWRQAAVLAGVVVGVIVACLAVFLVTRNGRLGIVEEPQPKGQKSDAAPRVKKDTLPTPKKKEPTPVKVKKAKEPPPKVVDPKNEQPAHVRLLGGEDFADLQPDAALLSNRTSVVWNEIPPEFQGYQFSKQPNYVATTAFEVQQPGIVMVAFTERWGGGGSDGDWKQEVVSRQQLEEDGWREVAKLTSRHGDTTAMTWVVFEKPCAAGETFLLRTEKYYAPVLLSKDATSPPLPMAKKGTAKPPPPGAAASAESEKLIGKFYGEELAAAKTPGNQIALAKKFIGLAERTDDDPSARYVLLVHARRLAQAAGDWQVAWQALDATDRCYEIDVLAERTATFLAIAKTTEESTEVERLVETMLQLINETVAAKRYDLAQQLATSTYQSALKSRDVDLRKRTLAVRRDVDELWREFGSVSEAKAKLQENPKDPEANLTLGKHVCFVTGDWQRGLPMLALGGDAALGQLAKDDLAAQELFDDAATQAALRLGNRWWEQAKNASESTRDAYKTRAGEWYRQTAPFVTGVAKIQIELRLKEIGEIPTRLAARPVDLLKRIDVKRDTIQGNWASDERGLVSPANQIGAKLKIPYSLPKELEYELTLVAERQPRPGVPEIIIGLVTGQGQGMVVLDAPWKRESFSGLEVIDGARFHNNETSLKGRLLKDGRASTIICAVRNASIRVSVDGQRIIDWNGRNKTLSLTRQWSVPDPTQLFLATSSSFRITKLQLKPIGVSVSRPDKSSTANATSLADGVRAGDVWDGNGLKMKFCWCPPGSFKMGEGADAVDATLTKGFWMGQTEVTQAQWKAVMKTQPKEWGTDANTKAGDEYPATWISWNEATKFCEELTKQQRAAGRLPDGWEYRLPTEAQWEYACRARTTTAYSFGDDVQELGDHAWYEANAKNAGQAYAHAVAGKKPNPWGLYDMHGNVWEWCRDWRQAKLPGGVDPEATQLGSLRVLRGGSWGSSAAGCRAAYRHGGGAGRLDNLGFRVAIVQDDNRK